MTSPLHYIYDYLKVIKKKDLDSFCWFISIHLYLPAPERCVHKPACLIVFCVGVLQGLGQPHQPPLIAAHGQSARSSKWAGTSPGWRSVAPVGPKRAGTSLRWRSVALKGLNERVRGLGSDAAIVVPVASHFDVAFVAPAGVPRVFDNPVLFAVVWRAVAHGQHPVVQLGRGALGVVVNTCGTNTYVDTCNGKIIRSPTLSFPFHCIL